MTPPRIPGAGPHEERGGAGGRLVVVATPIGNLGDLSDRAREALGSADRICCEDTRRTRSLLSAIGVPARGRLVSLHGHNERGRLRGVLEWLEQGLEVALVTDAGTPAVSDPGGLLVRAAADAGITVTAVPGPSAVLAALVVSGLAGDRFCVEGFLPRQGAARRRRFDELAERATDGRPPRGPRPGGGHPGGACGVLARPTGGGRPGAHQAPRGGVAGHPAGCGEGVCRTGGSRRGGDRARGGHRHSRRRRRRDRRRGPSSTAREWGAPVEGGRGCGGRAGALPPRRLRARRCGSGRRRTGQTGGDHRRRYAGLRGALLHHDAHLLRQRRAARRSRLHDGAGGRAGPLAPPRRRRRLLPHRHGRARGQGGGGRGRAGREPKGVDGSDLPPVPGGMVAPRDLQRRLHPDHRGAAPPVSAALPAADLRPRLHRARHLPGPLLRLLRGLLHRGTARRRPVPDPPPGRGSL